MVMELQELDQRARRARDGDSGELGEEGWLRRRWRAIRSLGMFFF